MTQTILVAGATGMLGGRIAHHLLDQPKPRVRLLVREVAGKKELLDPFAAKGAELIEGDLTDPASLDRAAQGIDVIVSAVQGGPESIIDGQVALARAATYWMQGILWIMLADREDTGGRWSMMEQLMPKGAGPPPHKHLWSDETFYILDGTITYLINDEIKTASKGAFVNIARNTRHAFRVDSDTARILNGYTPSSMEAMIAELGKRTDERTLPPPGPPQPPGKPQMPDELLTRYGLIWLDELDPLAPRGHR